MEDINTRGRNKIMNIKKVLTLKQRKKTMAVGGDSKTV